MKSRAFWVLVLALGLGSIPWIATVAAETPDPPRAAAAAARSGDKTVPQDKTTEFLRITRNAKNAPLAMESAVVTYVPRSRDSKTPSVDLVSAVHIGEKSYYDALNKLFTEYDVVLYEMVAPEGAMITKEGGHRSNHPISWIQRFISDNLDLKFQLSEVDYTRPNFVHADLSPEQFSAAMEKRQESFFTLFLRMMALGMSKQGESGPSNVDVLMAFISKDHSLRLKRVMAKAFEDLGGSMNFLEGPNGSALVTDRNKRALEVLQKEISAGKKKIAIFYGAAHMSDFERHLRNDFGLVPEGVRWLVAWDLKVSSSAKAGK